MKTAATTKPVTSAKSVMATKSAKPVWPEMRVLKTGSCTSLTGKGKLTYQIGCEANPAGKPDIQFRIYANTGGGFFNNDWVSLTAIQATLDKLPSGTVITSFVLVPLFRGKSSNSPGFLLAALKNEGLVQAVKDKKRCYERVDTKDFVAEMKALMTTNPGAVPGKASAVDKKTPTKSSTKKKP